MSKNAIVLDDHFGDSGRVTAGQILLNVTSKRFDHLEKRGLVREATAEEVAAGDQIAFEPDTSGIDADPSADDANADAEADAKKKPAPSNKAAPAAGNKAG